MLPKKPKQRRLVRTVNGVTEITIPPSDGETIIKIVPRRDRGRKYLLCVKSESKARIDEVTD